MTNFAMSLLAMRARPRFAGTNDLTDNRAVSQKIGFGCGDNMDKAAQSGTQELQGEIEVWRWTMVHRRSQE